MTSQKSLFLNPNQKVKGEGLHRIILIAIGSGFVLYMGFTTLFSIKEGGKTEDFSEALARKQEIDPDYRFAKPGKDVPLQYVFRTEKGYPMKTAVAFQHNGKVFEMENNLHSTVMGTDFQRKKLWRALKNTREKRVWWEEFVEEGISLLDSGGLDANVNEWDRRKWKTERDFSYVVKLKGLEVEGQRGHRVTHQVRTHIDSSHGNKDVKIGVELLAHDKSKLHSYSITYTFIYKGKSPLPEHVAREVKNHWRDSFAELATAHVPED